MALTSMFCPTDGAARILPWFLSFYLPCIHAGAFDDRHCEKEYTWLDTRENRNTIAMDKALTCHTCSGANPSHLCGRWVLYPLLYDPWAWGHIMHTWTLPHLPILKNIANKIWGVWIGCHLWGMCTGIRWTFTETIFGVNEFQCNGYMTIVKTKQLFYGPTMPLGLNSPSLPLNILFKLKTVIQHRLSIIRAT